LGRIPPDESSLLPLLPSSPPPLSPPLAAGGRMSGPSWTPSCEIGTNSGKSRTTTLARERYARTSLSPTTRTVGELARSPARDKGTGSVHAAPPAGRIERCTSRDGRNVIARYTLPIASTARDGCT